MKIEEIINILKETKEETGKELEELINKSVEEYYPEEERDYQKTWRIFTNEYALQYFYDNMLKKLLEKELNNGNRNS